MNQELKLSPDKGLKDVKGALARACDPAFREAKHAVEAFNALYSAVLDDGDLEDWPEFFTEDGFYNIVSRENHDHGLPVGLVYCEGKNMMRDRAMAIAKTSMFGPRYLRHYMTNTRITDVGDDGTIRAEANYILIEVLAEWPEGRLHQAGRMQDVFETQEDGSLLLKSRIAIYDTLLVHNALVLPV
ncbi:aromatic-ring-hydroxylating dioxygenase subunit beta [Aquicoccus sp. G2-2]|jgi:3-phenylpropionate/cinnamic acid dioxygenase small subunit|uniref:aromatic-ring-hydroxylating dioxygenase subunit beta n=1 Tax=Aquicoccus sp. G2-2 TaxID=3092120 RepID=UPI002AE03E06|nr:nuclear transport factor 2 family protein [Aquicoccus sp. G2-2]MEA1113930.1 aromatic-ring-hydroxylating dioxygenase subunit beta [Aquicoccus sp. G2-2]